MAEEFYQYDPMTQIIQSRYKYSIALELSHSPITLQVKIT